MQNTVIFHWLDIWRLNACNKLILTSCITHNFIKRRKFSSTAIFSATEKNSCMYAREHLQLFVPFHAFIESIPSKCTRDPTEFIKELCGCCISLLLFWIAVGGSNDDDDDGKYQNALISIDFVDKAVACTWLSSGTWYWAKRYYDFIMQITNTFHM